jgi:hypothetical protein
MLRPCWSKKGGTAMTSPLTGGVFCFLAVFESENRTAGGRRGEENGE